MPPNTNLRAYTFTRLHAKKSQSLFFALFLLAVVGTIAGTLAFMWHTEIRARASSRDGLIAFYLAQAGIERAKIWTSNNPASLLPYSSPWFPFGSGQYNFIVAGGPNLTDRILNSIGQTLDASGAVIAEKQITVQVKNIESPVNNLLNDAQTANSWREI